MRKKEHASYRIKHRDVQCFRADAGNGHTTERDVQLSISGGAGAGEASVAGDPEDDGRSAGRVIGKVQRPVLGYRTAVDRAGEAVAGVIAADPIHGTERTAIDGAVAIQPAVP